MGRTVLNLILIILKPVAETWLQKNLNHTAVDDDDCVILRIIKCDYFSVFK
jgi:hypothetical protein